MNYFGTGFIVIVTGIILGLVLLAPIEQPQAQFTGVPVYRMMSISGHRYIIMTYKDSIAVVHDESCN